MSRVEKALWTWLQLLRAPNLFTVPGDPLAGYILASFGSVGPAIFCAVGASLCLYAAGLLDNDLADLAEDRAERPARPLPSGAARPRAVATTAIALTAAGLLLAAAAGVTTFYVALVLTGLIALYNHCTKPLRVVGALNMGLCRGTSVLLGATAAPHGDLTIPLLFRGRLEPLHIAMLTMTVYIAAVTNLARHETKETAPAAAKGLPLAALLFGTIAFLRDLPHPSLAGGLTQLFAELTPSTFWSVLFLFVVAASISGKIAWSLAQDPAPPIPPAIGQSIRLLLLLQAAFCAANGSPAGAIAAMLLMILWPLSRAASQRFYAS